MTLQALNFHLTFTIQNTTGLSRIVKKFTQSVRHALLVLKGLDLLSSQAIYRM